LISSSVIGSCSRIAAHHGCICTADAGNGIIVSRLEALSSPATVALFILPLWDRPAT
jgi:hypothetical protein